MYIQCLGCGDAFGSGGRLNSCFFIRTLRQGILLDCGASSLIALKKENLSTNDIDVIIISHFHGDHFGGVPFFICEILAAGSRNKPLTIIGPEGINEKAIQTLECFFPGVTLKNDSPIRFLSFTTENTMHFNDMQITAYKAVHSPETNPHALSIRVEDKIIAYSGDTEWMENLISVSKGADLFICEGSAYNQPLKHHLSIEKLSAERSRIDAKTIVLTHLGPEALQHRDTVPFAVAFDGAVLMDE